jgi:hypothetical protein
MDGWGVLLCARRLIWASLSAMHSGVSSGSSLRKLLYDFFYNLLIPMAGFSAAHGMALLPGIHWQEL